VQPFIRYEVGDVVTMAAAPCRCGSRLPRVERIEGRAADTFWILDGSSYRQVIGLVFSHAFEHVREVREWQAVQIGRNRIRIRLEPLPGAAVDEAHARRMLDRELALYDFQRLLQVDLEVVPRLTADAASGKYRRMVSQVGPPADLGQQWASPPLDPAVPDLTLA
jgi:phenylacetate-coenzyme A ligase PaaK-like adenylate-forming protein